MMHGQKNIKLQEGQCLLRGTDWNCA